MAVDLSRPAGPRGGPRPRPPRRRLRRELRARRGRAGSASTTRRWPRSSPTSSTARSRASGRPGRGASGRPSPTSSTRPPGMMTLEQGDEAAPRASNLQAADVLAAAHAMGAIMAAPLAPGPHRPGRLPRRLDAGGARGRRQRHLRLGAERRRGARQSARPAMIVHRIGDRLHGDADRGGAPALGSGCSALMERPELGRDPALHLVADRAGATGASCARSSSAWLDTLRHPWTRRWPCSPRPPHPVRAGAAARGGDRPGAPGRARLLPGAPPPGAGRSAGDREPRITWTASPRIRAGPRAYRVGEHTRAVLRDLLGYKDDRIAELIAAGVVEGPA